MRFILNKLIFIVIILMIILGTLKQCTTERLLKPINKQSSTVKIEKTENYVIGFFNGVGVKYEEALNSKKLLEIQFSNISPSNKPIQYQLFYNDTYGYFADLLEVLEQRNVLIENDSSIFWNLAVEHKDNIILSQDIQKSIVDISNKYLSNLIKKKNLETSSGQRKLINQLVNKHSKFIFISHSQGNLFGVSAYKYTKLIGGKVSIIHLAPPINLLKGDYVLSSRDIVINRMRTYQHVPDANIDPPKEINQNDYLGHGFNDIYFNERNVVGGKSIDLIKNLLQ